MEISQLKKLELSDIKSVFFFALTFVPSLYLRLTKKSIWLCVERIDVADDNAWMFFRWMREHQPCHNVYFIVDSHNPQFIHKDFHFIAWGSLRHYAYYLASTLYIMATFNTPAPNGRVCGYLNKIFHREVHKIYLRHGISKDGMEEHRYEIHHFRLFICGAKPEYDYVKIAGGYPDDNVKYTGFARFDDLLANKRDDHFILIIPTWRKYIGVDSSKSQEQNEQLFLQSAFYQHYMELINGRPFIEFLQSHNLKARFCLHAEYRRFEKFFKSICPNIDIVSREESIHTLLMTTSLLITDYSSVFFDAAYADKPVIYYHFDYEEFRKNHLHEGYFSYDRDGMGPIAQNISELLRLIKSCESNDTFVRTEKYIERARRFFPLHDTHNCERIYYEIIKTQSNG